MTQRLLQDSARWLRVENWLPYDWPVYAAFLPALLTLAGIAFTVAITTSWPDRTFAQAVAVTAMRGDVDDYVQGLIKLGIAKLPSPAE
jgi:hypothetical protein